MRVFLLFLFAGMFHAIALSQNAEGLSGGGGDDDEPDYGQIHGNFQFDGQYYFRDPQIDPTAEAFPDERFLGQGFANFIYSKGNFRAGVRYENYQNPIIGYPEGYVGEGIPYRFAQYKVDNLDVTVGNFYEQFGSGMTFRSYEERGLGLDNAMDGVRLRYSPLDGLDLKGVIGKQRVFFNKGAGIIRGVDAEMRLNRLFPFLEESKTRYWIGGSFVSRFQPDNDPFYNLPQNVALGGGRMGVEHGGFQADVEYVYKANDPSADNGFIYRPGTGLLLNMTYARKGFSAQLSGKRLDNMAFRSDRYAQDFDLFVNFLPPTTKFHTYALPALYPYQTRMEGEMGVQFELAYMIPRSSPLGGKYGTKVTFNYSDASSVDKSPLDEDTPIGEPGTDGYRSNFFKPGDIRYFRDVNLEIKKTLSRKWSFIATYYNIEFNESVIFKGVADRSLLEPGTEQNILHINAAVLELLYKIKPRHSLRMELQGLFQKKDRGDMVMALAEYSFSPRWFFALQNIYNYGHPDPSLRTHYPLASLGYTLETTRFQVNAGRQQGGVFCVGGICRFIPASTGISLTVTTNF